MKKTALSPATALILALALAVFAHAEMCDCTGDLNEDGSVGVPDLLILLGCWGPVGQGCECADMNSSGSVGAADLLTLLGQWGDCPEPICPGEGDCCIVNGSPGCSDGACCEMICKADPFCCDVWWDGNCALQAHKLCEVCQQPGACCFNDNSCQDAMTPAACAAAGGLHMSGGTVCVDIFCHNSCSMGDCCVANNTPGCHDPDCCNQICAFDPFCCDVIWDLFCAISALNQCQVCQQPGACCLNDGSCVDGLTPNDCVALGGNFQGIGLTCDTAGCPMICGPGAGDCCVVTPSLPGCEDPVCCDCVCAHDPFCCLAQWDGTCAAMAAGKCSESCPCE